MKTLLVLGTFMLLPGCTLLTAVGGALGITGMSDLAPSLKYCERVEYKRVETKAEIRALCTVPAGG